MIFLKRKRNIFNLSRGISLVEFIIVIGILGGVVGLVGSFQAGVFRMNRLFGNAIDVSFEGNRLIKEFTQTVRPLAQSVQGAFPVDTVATSTFIFFSDIDHDGVTERIRYFLFEDTLKKGVTEPEGSPPFYNHWNNETVTDLVHYVRNGTSTPIFSYYDRDYTGTTTALTYPITTSVVRHVQVQLILDKDDESPPPFMITTGVTFRNLKDNQ